MRRRLGAEAVADARLGQQAVVAVAREVARRDVLVERGRVQVGGHLQRHEAVEDRAARGDPADAHAAADRLRERVDVDHVARRLAAQRRRRVAVEGQPRVDAVLEHEERALARQLEQALAALAGEMAAGRVLARGLERDELDRVAREHALERLDVEAVGVGGDAEHARAGRLEGAEDPDVRRRLDADDVVLADDRARDEVDRLARAGGDQDLLAVDGEALLLAEQAELVAQLRHALDVRVRERVRPELGEGGGRRGGQLGYRQRLHRGQPDAEGDHVRPGDAAHRLLQDALASVHAGGRQRDRLPVVVQLVGGERRQRAHERALADRGREVAELAQAPVDAGGRERVHVGEPRELARRRQPLAQV